MCEEASSKEFPGQKVINLCTWTSVCWRGRDMRFFGLAEKESDTTRTMFRENREKFQLRDVVCKLTNLTTYV